MAGVMPELALGERVAAVGEGGSHASGRIPFRIRVGVTGHLHLPDGLAPVVHEQLRRALAGITGLAPDSTDDVRLAVVSQLAEGADRLLVGCVLDYAKQHGEDAQLEVVLPFEREEYIRRQKFSEDSRREFDKLLKQASVITEPDECVVAADGDPSDQYVAAGKKVIRRCDLLVAIWDGEPPRRGKGGTAHTLLMAAAQAKPCIWIPADGGRPFDNLQPGSSRAFFDMVKSRSGLDADFSPTIQEGASSLQPLRTVFDTLEQFNAEPRTWQRAGSARVRVAQRMLAVIEGAVERKFRARLADQLQDDVNKQPAAAMPRAIAASLARGSLLADHYRRRFMALAALVLVCASLAACALGVGVAKGHTTALWAALELGFLLVASIVFVLVQQAQLHSRWLSYRVLSERLRTAWFIARVGIDFRAYAELQGGWIGNPAEQWLMRALEELWGLIHSTETITLGGLPELKRLLLEDWLEGQLRYHRGAVARHDRLRRQLLVILRVAIGLVVLLAALKLTLITVDAGRSLKRLPLFFLIALPVAAGSLGAWLTINQHDALHARSAQTLAELELIKQDIRDAGNACALRQAAAAAARVVSSETSTWLGQLWFLDIEHP